MDLVLLAALVVAYIAAIDNDRVYKQWEKSRKSKDEPIWPALRRR